jgi:hypothetical protein
MEWPAPFFPVVYAAGPPEGKECNMAKEIAVLGIDLGKNSGSLAGLDATGECPLVRGGSAEMCDRDGGVLWRPSSCPSSDGARSRG